METQPPKQPLIELINKTLPTTKELYESSINRKIITLTKINKQLNKQTFIIFAECISKLFWKPQKQVQRN